MKKLLMISLILLAISLTSGPAHAWRGHFGIFVPPPPFPVGPPAIYYRGHYPPPSYYGPDYYYNKPYRVWVPRHWERRWTPYGWKSVWIPGHWQYGP